MSLSAQKTLNNIPQEAHGQVMRRLRGDQLTLVRKTRHPNRRKPHLGKHCMEGCAVRQKSSSAYRHNDEVGATAFRI